MMKVKELVDANWNWVEDDLLTVTYFGQKNKYVVSITVKDAKDVYGNRLVWAFHDRKVWLK